MPKIIIRYKIPRTILPASVRLKSNRPVEPRFIPKMLMEDAGNINRIITAIHTGNIIRLTIGCCGFKFQTLLIINPIKGTKNKMRKIIKPHFLSYNSFMY